MTTDLYPTSPFISAQNASTSYNKGSNSVRHRPTYSSPGAQEPPWRQLLGSCPAGVPLV